MNYFAPEPKIMDIPELESFLEEKEAMPLSVMDGLLKAIAQSGRKRPMFLRIRQKIQKVLRNELSLHDSLALNLDQILNGCTGHAPKVCNVDGLSCALPIYINRYGYLEPVIA